MKISHTALSVTLVTSNNFIQSTSSMELFGQLLHQIPLPEPVLLALGTVLTQNG